MYSFQPAYTCTWCYHLFPVACQGVGLSTAWCCEKRIIVSQSESMKGKIDEIWKKSHIRIGNTVGIKAILYRCLKKSGRYWIHLLLEFEWPSTTVSRFTHLCIQLSARPFKVQRISDFNSVHLSGTLWRTCSARPFIQILTIVEFNSVHFFWDTL